MCKDCFNKEYLSFPSQKDFDDFDLELSKKLSRGRLKHVGDDGKYLVFGYSIYKCQTCGTTWWLSDPDNSWRGYFAHDKNAKHILNENQTADKRKRQGFLLIIILLGLAIIGLTLKTCN